MERTSVRHELKRRSVTVREVRRLTPNLVRITLVGDDLRDFSAPGPADHVRLLLPAAHGFAEAARDFTPSRSREDELDIDVVLHGDEGPASAFASHAQPGDPIGIGGPRGSRLLPAGMERLVLVADATALPAAARWIRQAPAGVPVTALLRIDETDAGYLAVSDATGADLHVLADDAALEAALRSLAPFDESTYLFLAGEAGALVPLRRYLRRELGLPTDQLQVSGYWRRGVAGLDHHAPVDPDDPD